MAKYNSGTKFENESLSYILVDNSCAVSAKTFKQFRSLISQNI